GYMAESVCPPGPAPRAAPSAPFPYGTLFRSTDTAVLSGGYNPTGTITFTLYLGASVVDTETVSVSGNGSYVTPSGYLPAATGTYHGRAHDGTPGTNKSVITTKADKTETVIPA